MTPQNLSLYIDPETCRSCGECCKNFEIAYDKDLDPIILSEMHRFQMLRGIGKKITIQEEDGMYWLVFNFPCEHLRKVNGRYSCAIYNSPDRPLLCRHFPYKNSTTQDCPDLDGESP
jgi:Fe-S-cluster containining protein